MFKATLPRFSVLLAALTLASALCACSPEAPQIPESRPEPDPEPVITPEPEPEPEKTLSELFEVSAGELSRDFGASPLSALEAFFAQGGLTAEFQGSLAEPVLSYSGTLVLDGASGAALARLNAGEGVPEAGVYYDGEFAGVSCEPIFGDGRFYGLRPYGLAEQLRGSALASVLSLNMEAVAELDALLDSIPEDVFSNPEPLSRSLEAVTRRLIAEHEFERRPLDAGPDGKPEGFVFTAGIPDADLAGYLREIFSGRQELAAVLSFVSGMEKAPDIDGAIDALKVSGGSAAVTFTADRDRVTRVEASCRVSGRDVTLEALLFGGEDGTLSVKLAPFFVLELTPGPDVHMALTAQIGSGSTTTLDWTADGTLDFITYTNDITTLALDGTLSVSPEALRFDGVWTSGNRGDLNPLTLTCAPGGQVPEPEGKVLFTDMTERQIFLIVTRAVLKAL